MNETIEVGEGFTWSFLNLKKDEWDRGARRESIASYLVERGKMVFDEKDPILEKMRDRVDAVVHLPIGHGIQAHRYKLGPARLLAFERNIVWQVGEDLKQAGGNEALEKPVTFEAKLPAKTHVYDLRSGKYLGEVASIPVTLDPWQPSLFALTKTKLPDGDIVTALENAAPRSP